MNKKIIIYILVTCAVAFIGSWIVRFYIDVTTPDFLNEMVEDHKNDKEIMAKIGGYKNYKYSYNENDLKKDTLPFSMTIYGNRGQVDYNGYAIKKNDDWMIRHLKDTIQTVD
ncbi:hypothetical protein D770_04205 [Flammeovirgaceae bacterium 311]|nr:hypothetical protein D770_04170 [Flammeovirgaceae bacterium 311]AHM59108.1 hypothetical protein D770_04205 [Flammeovirgaceae bacterium 311]